jgi:PAS domain S-box-containing protein
MFELSGIGMFQADAPAFRFTRVNRKFCEIIGYSAEELLTKSLLGLTHPQDRRRGMSDLSRMVRGKTDALSIEKRCVRKDGSVIHVSVNGTMVRDASGRALRIMAMIGEAKGKPTAGKGSR